uniref:UPF0193 protein EVG1 n=1 Tax=Cacopsylla melanoneura TaxID=428564 RepID=A0A8D8ZC32_9HEMI
MFPFLSQNSLNLNSPMDYSDYNTAPRVHVDGGIYTHRVPEVSLESKQFIKELIRESQLAHVHRKFIETIVENGKALPPLRSESQIQTRKTKKPVVYSRGTLGKRTEADIRNSGAYDVEPYVSKCPQANVEREKARLQSIMEYGKVFIQPQPLSKPKTSKKKEKDFSIPSLEERFQTVFKEIKERSSFLNEMADMGQAEQYRPKIQAEISERVRELEKMSEEMKNKVTETDQCIEQFRQILPRNENKQIL